MDVEDKDRVKAADLENKEDKDRSSTDEAVKSHQNHVEEFKMKTTNLQGDLPTLVTNIQSAADARESMRRAELENARRLRLEPLWSEVKSCQEDCDAIWERLLTAGPDMVPQELQEELKKQQQLSEAIVDDKMKLINELKQKLKVSDDRLVKELRICEAELDLVVETMDEEIKTLEKTGRKQLAQTEEENETCLKRDKSQWETYLKELQDKELERLEERQKAVDEYEAKIHHLMLQYHSQVQLQFGQGGHQGKKLHADKRQHFNLNQMRDRIACLRTMLNNLGQKEKAGISQIKELQSREKPHMLFMERADPKHPQSTDGEMNRTGVQDESGGQEEEVQLTVETVKKVMELLCNEAGFLLEDKLQSLLAPLEKEDQTVLKLGSLLSDFSMEEEDIPKLAHFLLKYKKQQQGTTEQVCAELRESSDRAEEATSSASHLTPDLIDPNNIVSALNSFLKQHVRSRFSTHKAIKSHQNHEQEYEMTMTNLQRNMQGLLTSSQSAVKRRAWLESTHRLSQRAMLKTLEEKKKANISQIKELQDRNQKLSMEMKRGIEQQTRLQNQIKHFSLVNAIKIKQMRLMLEEEIKQNAEKLLFIDSQISKHLGLVWERPQLPFMEAAGPKQAQKTIKQAVSGRRYDTTQTFKGNQRMKDASVGPKTETDTQSTNGEMNSTAVQGESGGQEEEVQLTVETVKKVMELLCNEAGFLLEDKLQSLLAPLEKEDQTVLKLGSLLSDFSMEEEDIPKLAHFLLKYKKQQQGTTEQVCAELRESSDRAEEATSSASHLTPDLIDPNNIVSALNSFLKQHVRSRFQQAAARDTSVDKAYWKSFGNIISDDRVKLWEAAERKLKEYIGVLTDIKDIKSKIQRQEQQNAGLRMLLQQSQVKVNTEVKIPAHKPNKKSAKQDHK